MTDTPTRDTTLESPDVGRGEALPDALPWTLVVDGEDWSADLEYGAALPRVGDRIDFIADDGRQRTFRVTQIVHTLQSSATGRPTVGEEHYSPNSTVDRSADAPPRQLRAGLPRVIVTPEG